MVTLPPDAGVPPTLKADSDRSGTTFWDVVLLFELFPQPAKASRGRVRSIRILRVFIEFPLQRSKLDLLIKKVILVVCTNIHMWVCTNDYFTVLIYP
jgi:hypothetical protein